MRTTVAVKPGVLYFPGYFDVTEQTALLHEINNNANELEWFQPTMPRWGTPFSVRMMNFGPLGWVSDKSGYRYQATHPACGRPWPPIPAILLDLWRTQQRCSDTEHGRTDTPEGPCNKLSSLNSEPEACLVNYYGPKAKMGLHQDRDEEDLTAPVVSVSLGDTALFRIGTDERNGPTQSLKLHSGDVLVFGGPARLAFHGIDRIYPGTSRLLPEGGRINLTLRRVTRPMP